MSITNPKQDIVISPEVLSHLIDSIDVTQGNVDLTVRELVQEIIDRAKIFIARFENIYFLRAEPIHEFVGLEYRDSETGLLAATIPYRMVLHEQSIGIFTIKEVPIDDMYDIRLLIAESQLPEYQ